MNYKIPFIQPASLLRSLGGKLIQIVHSNRITVTNFGCFVVRKMRI